MRLEAGEAVEAREHTTTAYDEGEPTPPAGTPPAFLPTKETAAAVVPGTEGELEPRVTVTHYDWNLRLPTETIIDPGGLDIRPVTAYNAAGQVVETRQPKGAGGGTAGDTQTDYWSATGSGECGSIPRYANLPCKVAPTAQASGSGRPQLLVKKYTAYNDLDEPTTVVESPGGGTEDERRTITSYDAAGRQKYTRIVGGGAEVPETETVYDATTGLPGTQRFVCREKHHREPEEGECVGFKSRSTTTTYDILGQVTAYEDADGNRMETTYDAFGRPVTTTDDRGSRSISYDEASGLPTSLEVSGVGTFTASYDADGNLVEQGLPDGLAATTTYNQADEPMGLAWTKEADCGESCTWYEETLERSIEGRILTDDGTLVDNSYSYDKDGRLIESRETPSGGGCTSRAYAYDADSNRLTRTVRAPTVGGACATSGGTPQKYEYDAADRLEGPTYDAFGRITDLPAEFAGGHVLTTSYYSTNMVATQSQGGITNNYELDATGRQRARLQGGGGLEGTEVFHYDGPSDSPAWTERGGSWTRDVVGIGGDLTATQGSDGTTTFDLTDLRGDVVATASAEPAATELLTTFRSDEFGEPESGEAGRFGWLGGKERRTELASGVIQMGARSYIPQLGRFLTPDPVPGGSANPYGYADQDPVNGFDLEGTCSTNKRRCVAARRRRAERRARRGIARVRTIVRKARNTEARRAVRATGTGIASDLTIGPAHLPFPNWEQDASNLAHKAELFLGFCPERTV